MVVVMVKAGNSGGGGGGGVTRREGEDCHWPKVLHVIVSLAGIPGFQLLNIFSLLHAQDNITNSSISNKPPV